MPSSLEIVLRLTESSQVHSSEKRRALKDFAHLNGWHPSDEIEEFPGTEHLANGHLVVEHGLDHTAVISFLKPGRTVGDMGRSDLVRLLEISYNNLVDWHLFPDRNGTHRVYNRTEPPNHRYIPRTEKSDTWRAETFDKLIERAPNPNLKGLDDALIETISLWKRRLASDLGQQVKNEHTSALFNTILLLRAAEDHRRRHSNDDQRLLIDQLKQLGEENGPGVIREVLGNAFERLELNYALTVGTQFPHVFDGLDRETLFSLFLDFYKNKFAPYRYDFSIISKHALSRIYERYVSTLRDNDSPELILFKELPVEVQDRSLGGVYTPQYIARFFARFLKENHTPRAFRTLKTLDPACGSGMFLRTLLEMQCDPLQDGVSSESIDQAFQSCYGIDVDPNACRATELSLALLYLVLRDQFPREQQIINNEAIAQMSSSPEWQESFDVVIANPPFVKWDMLVDEMRERVRTTLGSLVHGKADLFLALLKLSLDLIKPNGFLAFVLPHSFLISEASAQIRKRVAQFCWVRVLADLSEIPVFEHVGSYVVLLIAQRKSSSISEPRATILRCRDFVGHALQDVLDGKDAATPFYQVFQVDQRFFTEQEWVVAPPSKSSLLLRLQSFPRLSELVVIREGFVTGADRIFTLPLSQVPVSDREIWRPYLRDREMTRYSIPKRTEMAVFYPFANGSKLTLQELQKGYHETWQYLRKHEEELKARKSVKSGRVPWWSPAWPRPPKNMMRPKVVGPHLSIIPRFALDTKGKFAVSRSPLMYPEADANDLDLLRYIVAVLNSTIGYWQIVNRSHKYSRGYAMLEPKSLEQIRLPHPATVDPSIMKRLQTLVAKRVDGTASEKIDDEIDAMISDIFSLSKSERNEIGLEVESAD